MSFRVLWFVVAGFVIGFTTSTLWEWLYYRRKRLAMLEEHSEFVRDAGRHHGAPPAAAETGSSDATDWRTSIYRSPDVFLESEQPPVDATFTGSAFTRPASQPSPATPPLDQVQTPTAPAHSLTPDLPPRETSGPAVDEQQAAAVSASSLPRTVATTVAAAAATESTTHEQAQPRPVAATVAATVAPFISRSDRPTATARPTTQSETAEDDEPTLNPVTTAEITLQEAAARKRANREATEATGEEANAEAADGEAADNEAADNEETDREEIDREEAAPADFMVVELTPTAADGTDPSPAVAPAATAPPRTTVQTYAVELPVAATRSAPPQRPPRERPADYPDDLAMIKGIGEAYKRKLYATGIYTWRQVAESDLDSLRRITRAKPNADIQSWQTQARELAEKYRRWDARFAGPLDDLSRIDGIGAITADMLYKAGICTYPVLAQTSPDELARIVPAPTVGDENDFAGWIRDAAHFDAIKRKNGGLLT